MPRGGGLQENGTAVIRNTIIAGNTAAFNPDVRNNATSQGHNFIGIADGTNGFGAAGDQIQMTRVYHHPWILEEGLMLDLDSTLMTPAALTEPSSSPLVHFSSGVNVQIWPPKNV